MLLKNDVVADYTASIVTEKPSLPVLVAWCCNDETL